MYAFAVSSSLLQRLHKGEAESYANNKEGKEGKDRERDSTLIHNPWCSYRNEDGHVGGDDDEGREAEAKYQDEEDVDLVTQR